MGRIADRLGQLGIELPAPKRPVANYLGCKRSGDLLFVSARVSERAGEVGTQIDREEAKQAARQAALSILSIVQAEIGDLDRIESVERMQGFVRSAASFTEQPYVIDGASEVLIEIFGQAGHHARTATGAAQLPFGAAVQLDMVMRMVSPG